MRKIYNSLILLTIFFTCFCGTTALGATPSEELTALLQNVKTMQADFQQYLLLASGQKKPGSVTSGKMMFERPGKFRWEIIDPNKQLIIANSKTTWIYDEDLAQVSKRKVNLNEPGNPALLLSGSIATLQKMFLINKTENGWFTLKPKAKNNIYHAIKLHFTADKLVAMDIADNLGQQSEIRFSNIQINQTIPASLFVFTAPAGVDVID